MTIIDDNNFKNKDLNEKVREYLSGKINQLEDNVFLLIEDAKALGFEISSLEEVLNLEALDDQEKGVHCAELKKRAEEFSKEKGLYEFLDKDDGEIEALIRQECSTDRLKRSKEKIDLYKRLGHAIEADQLEEQIRDVAKKRGVKKKTLDEFFGKQKTRENKTSKFQGMSHKEIIDQLNKKHAEMVEMKDYMILLESNNGKLQFQRESDFKKTYQHEVIGMDEKNRPITVADLWLKSFDKRRFNDITFNPDPNRSMPEKDYNLWKGFAFEPKTGDTTPFKEFIQEVICNNNDVYFEYIWAWLARMFQQPHEPAETAIVLKGKQGTGKNTFVEIVGKLLGNHFSPLSSIEQLLGRFDFHHANAILIHANEAIWGGDKRMLGKLKTLITERYVTVEQKHRDAITLKNCRHMVFSSNEDWPVHLDKDDRRFFVLEMSDRYKENTDYFKKLHEWKKNGGYEALLDELLKHDISDFNFRNVPQSFASLKIKMESASNAEIYVYEVLKVGRFDLQIDNDYICEGNELLWANEATDIPKNKIYRSYVSWCMDQKIQPENKNKFGRSLKKLVLSTNMEKKIRKKDSFFHVYGLPSIQVAREEFENSYKAHGMIDWDKIDSCQDVNSMC